MTIRKTLYLKEVITTDELGRACDPITPAICSEEIARAIGDNARLEIFENCGHGVHRDDPEGAERVMRAFLA